MSRARQSPVPLLRGTVAGLAAYGVGYLLTYLLASGPAREGVLDVAAGGETWRAVGWVFYSAHLVETIGTFSTFGVSLTGATNWIAGTDGLTGALYLVPPLVLLVAGVAVGRALAPDEAGDLAAGLTLVPAYAVCTVLGAYVLRRTGDVGTIGPDLAVAALAGAAYPLLFGVVGALAGHRT